ncbi:MAG: GrpB family protein [Acidobacteriota bacterium]
MSSIAKTVAIVPYDPAWPALFEQEARRLRSELNPRGVHHIGSTGVPGLWAKPVIDVLVETHDLAKVDRAAPLLEARGYDARGEYGIPNRRYFSRLAMGPEPKIHLHCYPVGNPHVARHLRFRDFLRAHPEEAERYGALKRRLAQVHSTDRDAYQAAKKSFIDGVESAAERWAVNLP